VPDGPGESVGSPQPAGVAACRHRGFSWAGGALGGLAGG